ncbi:MAG: transcriptional regulator [Candidatus Altiarchaeales archaeon]|nr:MAG: transcriptional regulator [Candidatus Altiarchaeales archaeon]
MEQDTSSRDMLAKNIAGEITLAKNPAKSIKKWREIFGINQRELSRVLKISPSVISDYESGRRRSPGVEFVRKFIHALISLDMERDSKIVKKFSSIKKSDAILDIREFLSPLSGSEFIKYINGKIVVNKDLIENEIWGYTVIDSIKAILELTENDFIQLYGLNTDRALVFTRVHLGRSPMIAIKVTKPKPSMVILHGLKPYEVDKLAIKIAETEKIPLVVSMLETEEELIEYLKGIEE